MRTPAPLFLLVFSLCATLLGFAQGREEKDPPPPPARHNPILREHFEERYPRFGDDRVNKPFLERYVDQQIDHFLEVMESDLSQMRQAFEEAEGARLRWLAGEDPEDRKSLRDSLREVERRAGDLRGRLRHILRGIDDRKNFSPPKQEGPLFEGTFEFLREHVDKAEDGIRDYFFRANPTVRYEDLQDENLLVHLYWIDRAAAHIRNGL